MPGNRSASRVFSGAGRPGKQHVVSPGGGDFQRPTALLLTLDIGQVQLCGTGALHRFKTRRRLLFPARQSGAECCQVGRDKSSIVAHSGGIGAVLNRQCQFPVADAAGDSGGGATSHRAQLSRQGQFAEEFGGGHTVRFQLARSGQDADGDGQVVPPAALGHVGGCQIDGDAPLRVIETRVQDGAAHPLPTLAHSRFRQPHEVEARQAGRKVRLDGDQRSFHPEVGPAVNARKTQS